MIFVFLSVIFFVMFFSKIVNTLVLLTLAGMLHAQLTRADTLAADPYDFWIAADTGNLDMVRLCVEKGFFVDLSYEDNVTPLMLAGQAGHIDIVEYLISKGANPNAASSSTGLPVLSSVVRNNDLAIAEYLIRNGAEIYKADYNGRQPLHHAVIGGYYQMADMLLYYDAPVNVSDSNGNTPLSYAVMLGNSDIAGLLLKNNADVHTRNENSESLIYLAAQTNQFGIVQYFYEMGIGLDEKGSSGMSIFDEFTIHGNTEALQWLIEKGAKPNDSITPYFNTRNLAKLSRNKQVRNIVKASGIKALHRPYFHYLGIGFHIPFNFDDVFLGIKTDLYDSRYGIAITSSAMIRPGSKAVWVMQESGVYYQLFESRYYVSLGLQKHVRLPKHLNFPLHLVLGVEQILTGGSYKSIEKNIPAVLTLSPNAGLFFKLGRSAGLSIGYAYLNLGNYNISPHRVNIGIRTSLNLRGPESEYNNFYIIKE